MKSTIKPGEKLNEKHKKCVNKLAVTQGIGKGFIEVTNSKEKPLQTLSDFLVDNN